MRPSFLLALVAALSCDLRPGRGTVEETHRQTSTQLAPSAEAALLPRVSAYEPRTLLTLGASAYGPTLAVDEEAVYLLTSDAAYRLVPGRNPERMALDLGMGPTLTREHILHWSGGWLLRTPKRGGESSVAAKVPHQPQALAASEHHIAWLDRADDGRFTVQVAEGQTPRVVYASVGTITALTILEERAFFLEEAAESGWRVGTVALAGGQPRFTPTRLGRVPAMLAAAGADALYFYDGTSYTVRRLSADLQHEDIVARDLVCSPIAAADRIYCGQVAGLFEISTDASAPRPLPRREPGLITKIATNPRRVAWLVDSNPDHLAVESISLQSEGQAPL